MSANSRVALVLTLAVALAGCDVVYGPTTPSAEWSVHDSAGFALHAKPGSFADTRARDLLDVLEQQYAHTSRVLGIPAGPRIAVFLYERGSDITPPLPNARAGVAFPETNALHAVVTAPLDNDVRTLLSHEANHVIVQNAWGRAGTSFMNEGLASALISEDTAVIGRTFLFQWTRTNMARLPRLADLIDDARWDSNSMLGYSASASFLAYLFDRYGAAALRQVYYARSGSFAARAAESYGKPLDALEAEWRAAVQ